MTVKVQDESWMSKLTFRADETLIQQIESLDASKSEIMRAALREYLSPSLGTDMESGAHDEEGEPVNVALETEQVSQPSSNTEVDRDVNIRISLEGVSGTITTDEADELEQSPGVSALKGENTPPQGYCKQCGEEVAATHVFCPNCGSKRAQRAFCECGDELRSDWAYCPGCGRRTPAANVLDES